MIEPRQLVPALVRLVLAWAFLSVAGYAYGRELAAVLVPLIAGVVEFTAPELRVFLSIVEREGEDMIRMTAVLRQPLAVAPGVTLPANTELPSATNVVHTLVPLVILFSLLIAYPARSLTERLYQVPIGVMVGALVVVLTAPFVLLGQVEIFYQELAAQAGVQRWEPLLLTWMIAMESGGRWVLGLVGAGLAAYLAAWMARPPGYATRTGPMPG